MEKLKDNIVYLKISSGHQIWIFKKPVNGYKYWGTYKKPQKHFFVEDDVMVNTK